MQKIKYVLVTPAHNEEENIEKTLKSVLSQTILPEQWVIVSDRSTDKTNTIVASYAEQHAFITFLKITGNNERHFGAKVRALQEGIAALATSDYDFFGVLDADLAFEQHYFEELFKRFSQNPSLGIGGGNYLQCVNGAYKKRIKNFKSVAGGAQTFRRECFRDVGGFVPLKNGSEDALIEITARMKGWQVQTFPELDVIHYGYVGGKAGRLLQGRFKRGMSYYQIGYLAVYMVLRSLIRICEQPFFIGSIGEIAGYFYARVRYGSYVASADVVAYLQSEQKEDLKSKCYKIFGIKKRI